MRSEPAVEFVFDVGSPTCYLAYCELPRIARRVGATIVWTPVALGGILQATGNASPASVPAKAAWMFDDLRRWADRYGVPFQLNPQFPVNTLQLMRGAMTLVGSDRFQDYLEAIFRALWVDAKDLADPETLASVLEQSGFDAEGLRAASLQDNVKAALRENTDKAVARGVFGCPTFFVGGELFFGQDRLNFVENALERALVRQP